MHADDEVTFRVEIGSAAWVSRVVAGGAERAFDLRTEAGAKVVYFSAPVTLSTQQARVELAATVPPVIATSKSKVAFESVSGGEVADQSIAISNAGAGALEWHAAVGGAGSEWLTVSPTSGTGPGTLVVSADTTGLTSGTHSAVITLSAPGAAAKQIPVTLEVTDDYTAELPFDYTSKAALLADGWDFLGRTSTGAVRDTEQRSGTTVQYTATGLKIPPQTVVISGRASTTRATACSATCPTTGARSSCRSISRRGRTTSRPDSRSTGATTTTSS